MVGARGQDWGRLLLRWPGADLAPSAATPPTRLTILLERAASTLALGRLIRRDAEGLERQIHRTCSPRCSTTPGRSTRWRCGPGRSA